MCEAEVTNIQPGIGLSGFGLFLSLTFLAKGYWQDWDKRHKATK
jgi:hypothetical protein